MSKLTNFLFGGVAAFFMCAGLATAQDAGELADEMSDLTVLEEPSQGEAPETLDLTIPENATPAELLNFVQGIEQRLPQPQTEEEMADLVRKISSVYKEIADRVLADESATDDERRQATELKVVAYTVGAQMGEEGAAEELDAMITNLIASAKTDEEKIQAYQVKLQAIAAAQADPTALDRVGDLADEILANKESEELQAFGLEMKAQEAFTRGRLEESAIADFVDFLNGYLADSEISQRAREKAQEIKLASLLMLSQSEDGNDDEVDAYFDEIVAGPLSPESRQAVYQMRVQAMMAAGSPGPGEPVGMSPEKIAKLDAIAEKLLAEESEDLHSMGYAIKSTNLVQRAQEDPANLDALFAFADQKLADNPSETLKKQMIGLKIQGHMIKVQEDSAAAKEMLAFLDEQLAGELNEETQTRLATVKLQVLMMQMQTDASYADELEKTLNEMKDHEELERVVQTGWGALYVGQIRNIAENGGTIDDFNAVFEQIKAKMNEMPILGFLVGNIQSTIDEIGRKNGDDELSDRVLEELIAAANESEHPIAPQVATSLQSILDLSRLQGSAIVIEGVQLGEDQNKFSTNDLSGKYFLIDIWSAKDRGYFELLEDLSALRKDFGPKGFEIVGINTDEGTDEITRAIDVLEMNWPVLSTVLSEAAGFEVLPEALAALPPGIKVLAGPDGTVEIIDDLDNIRAYLTEKLGKPESAEADESAESSDEDEAETTTETTETPEGEQE
ncbi:MAG: hypothetical protein ACOX6D_03615 [Thermoguttaceae bacterium]